VAARPLIQIDPDIHGDIGIMDVTDLERVVVVREDLLKGSRMRSFSVHGSRQVKLL